MVDPAKVAEVAAGLTKVQRDAIRDAKEAVWGWQNFLILIPCVYAQTYRCLERDGLVGTDASSRSLTPLGLAVRAHLEGTPDV